MTLPRFTSGSVGRLGFDHLNEAFGFIDAEQGRQQERRAYQADVLPSITARITDNRENGDHSWIEIVLDGDGFVPLDQGRTSSDGNDDYAYPARTLSGATIEPTTRVRLTPKRKKDGSLWYLVDDAASTVRPYRIISSTEIEGFPAKAWVYNVLEQTVTVSTSSPPRPTYSIAPGATTEIMFNTVEEAFDSVEANDYGVGMRPPTFVQMSRMPLKDELIVLATRLPTRTLVCCVPNPYRVICT